MCGCHFSFYCHIVSFCNIWVVKGFTQSLVLLSVIRSERWISIIIDQLIINTYIFLLAKELEELAAIVGW